MALVNITPPAGIFRNGTTYQAKGRWYDANLVRFEQEQIKPVGGWQKRSSAAAFFGACRAMMSWRDNSNTRWIAIGSSAKLYVQDEGGLNFDITPAGFTAGRDSATQNLGFGGGAYGTGAYGAPPPNTVAYSPASVWSLDGWGQDLAGCCDTDGKIYLWSLDTATPAAAVTGAPTGCAGILVTEEGFLFALGASGDGRKVAWCDQQDLTTWNPDATNQAGDYDLATVGTLQCGKAVPGGALLFTDVDVWLASYIGAPLVYGFERKGSGCGPISKGAISARDSIAVWMGKGASFWLFDGQSVQPLDCDVQDHVASMNPGQVSKVTAVHLANQGEVWWFYPSEASNENDSYVCWAYRESARLGRNVWTIGTLARTAGSGRGVFPNPLMVDASGLLYEHETGLDYDDLTPFIETGPWEIGEGDFMAEIRRVVPDQSVDGQLSAMFYVRTWPSGPETTYGPISLTNPTDVLFQAAEVRLRFSGQNAPSSWRLGNTRLDVVQGDPVESGVLTPLFYLDASNVDGSDVLL
jgi:hypothetical protein